MARQFTREELWHEEKINGHKITYLRGHNPRELLEITDQTNEQIPSNPRSKYGEQVPNVFRAAYRRGFISIRQFTYKPKKQHIESDKILTATQDTALSHVGIVEVPIARIKKTDGKSYVIFKWKYGKKAISLKDYLNDKTTPAEDKQKAISQAAEFLARLHLHGYEHGHPHLANFIVVGKGKVTMIDPTLLIPQPSISDDLSSFTGSIFKLNLPETEKQKLRRHAINAYIAKRHPNSEYNI